MAEWDGVYLRVGRGARVASLVGVGWHVGRIARMCGGVNGRLRGLATATASAIMKEMFVCVKLGRNTESTEMGWRGSGWSAERSSASTDT